MIREKIPEKNYAIAYIVAVLLVTWIVTIMLFKNPATGENVFGILMFIPAALAAIFNMIQHKSPKNKVMGAVKKSESKALIFGMLYPIIFVVICAFIAQITGIGKFNSEKMLTIKDIISLIVNIILSLIIVFGEEYGWRGYLLPKLTELKGKTKGTSILGIVWALYHAPTVYLLGKATGMSNPLLLCIIQSTVVFTVTFAFSYCYYLSRSLFPVLVFHAVWNTVNTTVLGDIYRSKQGIIEGNIMYLNGEGFLGLILGGLLIYWFVKQFKKRDKGVTF